MFGERQSLSHYWILRAYAKQKPLGSCAYNKTLLSVSQQSVNSIVVVIDKPQALVTSHISFIAHVRYICDQVQDIGMEKIVFQVGANHFEVSLNLMEAQI